MNMTIPPLSMHPYGHYTQHPLLTPYLFAANRDQTALITFDYSKHDTGNRTERKPDDLWSYIINILE